MKKSIIKKLFIKLCKIMGYEIIDQNKFVSPTLEKNLNEDLSFINKKSIVLPLGEVKITKKVSSVLIIFRTNTDIEIWDQNKKRLFDKNKSEYTFRSLNSIIKSQNYSKKSFPMSPVPHAISINFLLGKGESQFIISFFHIL